MEFEDFVDSDLQYGFEAFDTVVPESVDLTGVTELLVELRDLSYETQYIQLTQSALSAFIIALLVALIFAVLWGRH